MWYWALAFLTVALITGLAGVVGVTGSVVWLGEALFVVFSILFLLSMATMIARRPPTPTQHTAASTIMK